MIGFSEDWVKKEKDLDRSWYDMEEGGGALDEESNPFLGKLHHSFDRYCTLAATSHMSK